MKLNKDEEWDFTLMLRLDVRTPRGNFVVGQRMQAPRIDEIEDVYEDVVRELNDRIISVLSSK